MAGEAAMAPEGDAARGKRRLSDASAGDRQGLKRKGSKKKRRLEDGLDDRDGEGEQPLKGKAKAKGKDDEAEHERQRLSALLSTFSEEQMRRYESFRRSHFDKEKVKRLVARVSGCKVSNQLAVAMGGIAKIFAGELIELAREEKRDFDGPIHPLHIRSAYRRLRRAGKMPYLATPVRGLLE